MNKVHVNVKLPQKVVEDVDRIQAEFRRRDRTEAITEMLQLATNVIDRRHDIKDSTIVEYMRENLFNYQIVDWFAELPDERIEVLYQTILSERNLRMTKRVQK